MLVALVNPGWTLRLRRGMLEAWGPDGRKERIPLAQVDAIVVATRGAMISSALLAEAAALGIPVYLVTGRGDVWAVVEPGEAHRTADTQLAQAEWRLDPGRRLRAARWFILYKLLGRARMLRYQAKSLGDPLLREESYRLEAEAVKGVRGARSLEELRSVEARLGREYWRLYAERVLPGGLGFQGRRPRGGDPVNSALDYLYALLRAAGHTALKVAGLNPYIGFMHVEKSGRPSLTLDFMEVYRWRMEMLLASLARRGFTPAVEEGLLDHGSRDVLAKAWGKALESTLPAARETLHQAIVKSAWGLASALREGAEWRPLLGV